jgi:hypothetical protein
MTLLHNNMIGKIGNLRSLHFNSNLAVPLQEPYVVNPLVGSKSSSPRVASIFMCIGLINVSIIYEKNCKLVEYIA